MIIIRHSCPHTKQMAKSQKRYIYIYVYIYIYTVLYMYFSILHVCSVNKTKSTYSNSDFFQPQISWDHTRRKLMEIVVQQRIYFIGAVVSTLNYINAIWQVYLAQDFCTGNSYPNSQASFQNNRSCRFPLQVSKGKKNAVFILKPTSKKSSLDDSRPWITMSWSAMNMRCFSS